VQPVTKMAAYRRKKVLSPPFFSFFLSPLSEDATGDEDGRIIRRRFFSFCFLLECVVLSCSQTHIHTDAGVGSELGAPFMVKHDTGKSVLVSERCVCVCIYVCMCVYIGKCVYMCVYMCVCVCICVYICVYVCVH
jgi:hypothetical protein